MAGTGRSLSYAAYRELMAARADQGTTGLPTDEAERIALIRVNQRRSERIMRSYRVGAELARLLAGIARRQRWLVLTEPWCGDSGQCLPYVAAMAKLSSRITLRLLLRDENPAVMDAHLTDGTRSIPIVIATEADGGLLWRWGPRPAGAQAVFAAARAAGLAKPQALTDLHRWYARDRGRTLEAEFTALIRAAAVGASPPPGGR